MSLYPPPEIYGWGTYLLARVSSWFSLGFKSRNSLYGIQIHARRLGRSDEHESYPGEREREATSLRDAMQEADTYIRRLALWSLGGWVLALALFAARLLGV